MLSPTRSILLSDFVEADVVARVLRDLPGSRFEAQGMDSVISGQARTRKPRDESLQTRPKVPLKEARSAPPST